MRPFLAAIVAAVTLLGAAKSQACESVAIVAPSYSQAIVAPVVAAPVVYQPQVQAVTVQPVVAAYADPVVQQFVVQKVRVKHQQQFRTPVRSALRGGRCR